MASFFTYRKDLYCLYLLVVEIVRCVSRIRQNIKPIATKLVGLEYVRIKDYQGHVIQAMHTVKQRPPLLIPID